MSVYTKRGGVDYESNDWFKSSWDYDRIAKIRRAKVYHHLNQPLINFIGV